MFYTSPKNDDTVNQNIKIKISIYFLTENLVFLHANSLLSSRRSYAHKYGGTIYTRDDQKVLGSCTLGMTKSRLIVLGFNDTSSIVGHFVPSLRERENRNRRDSRGDEREGQGRKRNRNESDETEEIKTFSLNPYLLQGQQT